MGEILDIYTRDGKYLGTKEKEICHSENPGFYHKPAWVWIINSKNQILAQKRAAHKKRNPNKWDISVAGHVMTGETSIEGAIREVKEEIGIDTNESDYIYVGEFIYDITSEIAQNYILKLDLEIDKFTLREKEVSEIKWLDFDEFKELFNSDQFVEFTEEYRNYIINKLSLRFK